MQGEGEKPTFDMSSRTSVPFELSWHMPPSQSSLGAYSGFSHIISEFDTCAVVAELSSSCASSPPRDEPSLTAFAARLEEGRRGPHELRSKAQKRERSRANVSRTDT